METTAKILLNKLASLRATIGKCNKIAVKHGMELIHVFEGEVTGGVVDGEWRDYITVTVKGVAPRIPGLHLLGSRKMIDGLPAYFGDLPEKYRTQENICCDHCQTTRIRKKYSVFARDDGSEVVIGSLCIKSYFGDTIADALRSFAKIVTLIFDELGNGDDESTGFVSPGYKIDRYLAVVASIIEQDGFVSGAKAAQEGMIPTWLQARNAYAKAMPETRHVDYAKQVKDHFLEMAPSLLNNVEASLRVRLSEDFVYGRNLPYVAAAFPIFERVLRSGLVGASIQRAESQYVGEPGKRIELVDIEFIAKPTFDGRYGTTTIYLFLSEGANSLVWKTSASLTGKYEITETCEETGEVYTYGERWYAKPGDKVTLKASIAKHEPYGKPGQDPVKTTYLSRVVPIAFDRDNQRYVLTGK